MKRILRILHTADNHINEKATICRRVVKNEQGENVRALELEESFKNILQANHEEIDVIVIAGDLFHRNDPTNVDRYTVNRIIDERSKHVTLIVLIPGNHDIGTSYQDTAVSSMIDRRANVGVHPMMHSFTVGTRSQPSEIKFVCCPWGFEPPSRDPDDRRPNILVHHAAVSGYDTYNEPAIGVNALQDLGYDAVMLGHYHGQAELVPNKVAYPSCPEILKFNEEKQVKGYLIWNIYEDGSIELEKHEVAPLRKFLTLTIQDALTGFKDLPKDKETVVRFVGNVSKEQVPDMLSLMLTLDYRVVTNQVSIVDQNRIINTGNNDILTLAHEDDRRVLSRFLQTQDTEEEKLGKLMEIHDNLRVKVGE